MATGRGVNPKSVFTRTNPADAAAKIPSTSPDGQNGFDVRTRDRVGVKVQNGTNQIVAYRLLGYTFEDEALAKPVELLATANVAVGANAWRQQLGVAGIAKVQVEVDPAAAAVGNLTVVIDCDVDG